MSGKVSGTFQACGLGRNHSMTFNTLPECGYILITFACIYFAVQIVSIELVRRNQDSENTREKLL